MQRRVAAFDWSRTPLGPRDQWPASLASVVDLLPAQPLPVIAGLPDGVTEQSRMLAEQQAELLGVLGAMLLPLTDPQEIMNKTTQAVGLHLGTDRCYFAEWDEERGRVAVPAEWPVNQSPPLAGVYDLRDFGPDAMRHEMAEAVFRVPDVEALEVLRPHLASYRALGIRAFATAPFKRDSERVVTLTVTANHPRAWQREEMALVENVLARTWPLVERARTELHSRLLVRLSRMLAELNDADEIVRVASRMVGQHLAVTRCYFFEDLNDDRQVRVAVDWHPSGSVSVAGDYTLEDFGTPQWWAAVKTKPMSLDDTTREFQVDADRYRLLDIGAFATAPFLREGHWVAGLAVASPGSRRWTEDELTLLENVIARVWPVVERVRVANMLKLSNARLSLALAAGELGDFSWDLSSDELLVNERTMELFDQPPAPSLPRSRLRDLLHPDDVELAARANAHALATRTDYDVEYRVRRRSGEWRWIAAKGRGVYNDKGEAIGMRGVVQDINQRKLTEEKLRAQEAQLRGPGLDRRQRHRHQPGGPGSALPGLRAPADRREIRRHRHRTGHRAQSRGEDGRTVRHRIRRAAREYVLDRTELTAMRTAKTISAESFSAVLRPAPR